MYYFILLAIVQGLTEFLPVSSSGHLAMLQNILQIQGASLFYYTLLHLGTTLAMTAYFFQELLEVSKKRRLIFYIFVVTVITGTVGITCGDFIERLFLAPWTIGVAYCIMSAVLFVTVRFMDGKRTRKDMTLRDACLLGLAQALSLPPGISRSGLTISCLLFRGFSAEEAFRFSFIASIPSVIGAFLWESRFMSNAVVTEIGIRPILMGLFIFFIVGLLALRIITAVMRKHRFPYFGWYCMFLAVLLLTQGLFLKR